MNEENFGKLTITFEVDHYDIHGMHLNTVTHKVTMHEDSSLDAVREACVQGIKALGYRYEPNDEDHP